MRSFGQAASVSTFAMINRVFRGLKYPIRKIGIEWGEIFKELLPQPVRGLELLRPTSNRRTVEDRLILHMQSETRSNDRHFKRNEICSFFRLVQSFVRYFQNRFNFKKF